VAQKIEIVVEATGFDTVAKGAQNVSKSLAVTAKEAQKLDSTLAGGFKNGANQATQALTNLGRVAQDAPFGFIGIANNINPLLESFQRLKTETKSTGGALKALGSSLIGAGGLGLAVSVASSLLVVFGDKLFSSGKKADEAANAATKYKDAVKGIFEGQGKEATQALSLIAILKSEVETRERKLDALKALQKINPEIFKGLKLEGDAVTGLDAAYQSYIANIKNVVAAKILQLQLEDKVTKLLELQGVTQSKVSKDLISLSQRLNKSEQDRLKSIGAVNAANDLQNLATVNDRKRAAGVAVLNKEIEFLFNQLQELSKVLKVDGTEEKNRITKVKEDVDSLKRVILDVDRVITQDFLDVFYGDKTGGKPVTNIKPIGVPIEIKKPLIDEAKAKELGEQLTAFFESLAVEIGVAFGEALGNAIAGTGSIKGVFQSLFSVVGAALQRLGAVFIKSAAIIKKIESVMIKNPTLAIAGGIALVALGSVLKNVSAFAVGTRNAPGGLALVGERGPELISVPRGAQVTPAAQTANIIGGMQAIEVYGMVRGQDIYFSNKRFAGTLSRNT